MLGDAATSTHAGTVPTMSATVTAHRRASEFEPLALLRVVREVARSSTVDEPRRISTRSWDRARELSERFVDVPAARRICEHLGLPWEKIRELASMSGHAQRVGLGHALGGEQAEWLTKEYSCFALRLIARRLGAVTVTPGQYRAAREAMLGSGRLGRGIARRVHISQPPSRSRRWLAVGTRPSLTLDWLRGMVWVVITHVSARYRSSKSWTAATSIMGRNRRWASWCCLRE